MPDTLTPIFLAVALNAAARSQVSRTALMPCSVKCRVVMKVAIATFPPGEMVVTRAFYPGGPAPASHGGGRESACRSARLMPTACTIPAAFEVGRHPLKGLRNLAVIRDTIALGVFPIRPMGVREAVEEALLSALLPKEGATKHLD
jgi:hypothetical protein